MIGKRSPRTRSKAFSGVTIDIPTLQRVQPARTARPGKTYHNPWRKLYSVLSRFGFKVDNNTVNKTCSTPGQRPDYGNLDPLETAPW